MEVLVIAVIIGVVAYFAYRSRKAKQHYWQAFADSHGLLFVPGDWFSGPTLTGAVDDYAVHIDTYKTGGKNKTTWTRVAITPPIALPDDLTIGKEDMLSGLGKMIGVTDVEVGVPAVDERLKIHTRHEQDAQVWLGSPAGATAAIQMMGASCEVRDGRVLVRRKGMLGADVVELYERAVAIARQLAHSRAAPWRATAAQTGLDLVEQPFSWYLTGHMEGVTVDVLGQPASARTTITVPMPPGLPPGLHITRGTSDLGDVLLDRMVDARGADREALRSLLAQDGIREDLLAVVHAHPGSVVTADTIVVELPAFSDPELPTHIHDAVTLARRFAEQVGAEPASLARRVGTLAKP